MTAFESAIKQLEKALTFSQSDMAKNDSDLFEQFRNSTVQCFEYTYELSWKIIKRQLESSHPNPSVIDTWDFKDLIREAAVAGLIDKPEAWFEFRRLRNISSHAYDKLKAEEVYRKAQDLLNSAKFIYSKVKFKNP